MVLLELHSILFTKKLAATSRMDGVDTMVYLTNVPTSLVNSFKKAPHATTKTTVEHTRTYFTDSLVLKVDSVTGQESVEERAVTDLSVGPNLLHQVVAVRQSPPEAFPSDASSLRQVVDTVTTCIHLSACKIVIETSKHVYPNPEPDQQQVTNKIYACSPVNTNQDGGEEGIKRLHAEILAQHSGKVPLIASHRQRTQKMNLKARHDTATTKSGS